MAILNHCPTTRVTEVTSKIEGYFGFRTDFFEPILENGPGLQWSQGQKSNETRFNDYSKTRYFY